MCTHLEHSSLSILNSRLFAARSLGTKKEVALIRGDDDWAMFYGEFMKTSCTTAQAVINLDDIDKTGTWRKKRVSLSVIFCAA